MAPNRPSLGPFPLTHSTTSFWRSSTKLIDKHRSTELLPSDADIVIIGAGYTGAAITHHLIEQSERHDRPIPSIVILEAREACSGATGRNGTSWRFNARLFDAGRGSAETLSKVAISNQIHTQEQLAFSRLMGLLLPSMWHLSRLVRSKR